VALGSVHNQKAGSAIKQTAHQTNIKQITLRCSFRFEQTNKRDTIKRPAKAFEARWLA
jgi:hypothetical protein